MSSLLELFNQYNRAPSLTAAEATGCAIVDLVSPRIWRLLATRTRENAADDLLQAFWRDLFINLNRFYGTSEIEAWGLCYTIAHRRAADWVRQKRKAEMDSLDIEAIRDAVEASTAVAPLDPGQRLDIEDALKALAECDPRDVLCVTLRYFEEMSHKEIGHRVGLTEGGVRKSINRALIGLRNTLGEGAI